MANAAPPRPSRAATPRPSPHQPPALPVVSGPAEAVRTTEGSAGEVIGAASALVEVGVAEGTGADAVLCGVDRGGAGVGWRPAAGGLTTAGRVVDG